MARDWYSEGITYEEALKLTEPGERVFPDDCYDPRYEEEMAYWDAEEEAEEGRW